MQNELSYKVVGCAMKVHNVLGVGFSENIYGRCLAYELRELGLNFEKEQERKVFYKGEWVGNRRIDFVVEDKLLVEIKATSVLEAADFVQVRNYLDVFDMETGLLINFGKVSLEYKTMTRIKKI